MSDTERKNGLPKVAQNLLRRLVQVNGGLIQFFTKEGKQQQLLAPLLDKYPEFFGERGDIRRTKARSCLNYWYRNLKKIEEPDLAKVGPQTTTKSEPTGRTTRSKEAVRDTGTFSSKQRKSIGSPTADNGTEEKERKKIKYDYS